MVLDLISNISMIVAFLLVTGHFYKKQPFGGKSPLRFRIWAGLFMGLLGICLMIYQIRLSDTVIMDLRQLAIVAAASIGGPAASMIAALMIALFRVAYFGVSYASMVAFIAAILNGAVCSLIYRTHIPKPQKYWYASLFVILAASASIGIALKDSRKAVGIVLCFVLISLAGGIIIYTILSYLDIAIINLGELGYYRLMADNLADMLSTIKPDGTILYASPSSKWILGYEPWELAGRNFNDLVSAAGIGPEGSTCFWCGAAQRTTADYRLKRKDNESVWVETISKPLYDDEGKVYEYICVTRDISGRKRREEQLAESEERFRSLVNSMDDIVFTLDNQQRHTGVYGKWLDGKSLTEEMFIGRTHVEILGMEEAHIHDEANRRALQGEHVVYTWSSRGETGRAYYETSLSPIRNSEGHVVGIVGVGRNVTHQIAVENKLRIANEKLEKQTRMDGLTQISNRAYFDKFLAHEWKRAEHSQRPVSLIILDIDFFKAYNDTYGHLQGDECLKRIAQTLQEIIKRVSDITARYGGEEFAVVLGETGMVGALQVAENLKKRIEALNIPHAGSGILPCITVSMGIASMIPALGGDFKDLIRKADEALYRAKANGRNRIETYEA